MNLNSLIGIQKDEKPLDNIVTDGGYCTIFRRIACIGDSLSSGEFETINADGEHGYHDIFEYSWGQYIARSTGATVYNFSRGGMTAKEYIERFADENGFWDEKKVCQAYFIALGVNDMNIDRNIGSVDDICFEDYSKNKPTFAGYYAQIIQKIKNLEKDAKIFLVSLPRHGDDFDVYRKNHLDLLNGFAKVFENVYVINLFDYAPVYDAEFTSKFYYNGHMSPTGYVLSARLIESYVDYIIRKNPQDFKTVGLLGTETYKNIIQNDSDEKNKK